MSLEFDGIVDYVKFPNNTIPDNLAIVNPKYTLLCWCYATDLTGNDKYLISFQDRSDAEAGQSIVLKGASDATAGRIGFWHARGGSDGFPQDNYFRVDVKVTENNWHLVALRGTVSNIIRKISHTSSNSLPFSISTTQFSATNRLLIFFFCNESPNDLSAVSSVTYGGQNMTFVGVQNPQNLDDVILERSPTLSLCGEIQFRLKAKKRLRQAFPQGLAGW